MKNKSEHENYPVLDKLQHVVFYVNDLEVSQRFYEMILMYNVQPRLIQIVVQRMRLVGNTMKFYSFGHYQHDICLVQNPKVVVDNEQWNHYSLKLANGIRLDEIKRRLEKLRIPYFEGRMLPIFSNEQEKVIHFKDPNGHVIEVVE